MTAKKQKGKEGKVPTVQDRLREKCTEVRKLLKQEVLGRHQIGQIVIEVRDDRRTYGTGAVATLARACDVHQSTLYEYAQVAARWTQAQFEELLTKKGKGGLALSWSHIVELAIVEDDEKRTAMAEVAREKGLSVREMRKQAEEAKKPGRSELQDAEQDEPSDPQDSQEADLPDRIELPVVESPLVQVQKGLRCLVAYAEYFAQESSSWDAAIKQPVQTMLTDRDSQLVPELSKAIDVVRPPLEVLSSLLTFLEEAYAKILAAQETAKPPAKSSKSKGPPKKSKEDAA